MRKLFTIVWLALILVVISGFFYRMQWVYGLPTPVPKNYRKVDLGKTINLNYQARLASSKPLFIHFFNPDCPCSRFNIPHFKSLVKQYGTAVNFVIVPLNAGGDITAAEIKDKFDIDIPVLLDTTIAAMCGVYSTPQAAIIDVNHKLYYRGNYNKSRYCSDKRTEYAKIALEALLNNDTTMVFDELALKAYGCKLPLCTTK